jgi:hypothetical protein
LLADFLLVVFFLTTGFFVALAVGLGVALVVAPMADEVVDGINVEVERSTALAIRIGSARALTLDSI